MRLDYRHDFATGIVEYETTTNERVPNKLIFSANIPLVQTMAGYSASKVELLKADVEAFAKRNNITRVVFAQGDIYN